MLIYVPSLQHFFGTEVLNKREFGICVLFSFSMLFWIELEKLFIKVFLKKKMEI